jgi:hypothetical protein
VRPQGRPEAFAVDDSVRYRPGHGTYGYEPAVEADGRIPATVIGHTAQRVRIRFVVPIAGAPPRPVTRAVDAASLRKVGPS